MPSSPPSQLLFVQLQARFPSSSLITELVQIHNNIYVVRASVLVGKTPLVTGMAASASLETAEDEARLRVLNLLGIPVGMGLSGLSTALGALESGSANSAPLPVPPPAQVQPPSPQALSQPPLPVLPELSSEEPVSYGELGDLRGEPELALPSSLVEETPLEEEIFSLPSPVPEDVEEFIQAGHGAEATDFPGDEVAAAEGIEPVTVSGSRPKETRSPKPGKSTKPAPESEPDLGEPEDLSLLIALIGDEVKRVGWTKKQGSDYLKSAYGKATRQELDGEELMDFLNYLRALPSPNGL